MKQFWITKVKQFWITKVKQFLKRNNAIVINTMASIASVVLSIMANMLYEYLLTATKSDAAAPVKVFYGFSIITFTVILIYLISYIAEQIKQKIWPEIMDNHYMKLAFLKIRKLGSIRQETFQEAKKCNATQDISAFMIQECVNNMQLVVQSCYDFFDSAFSVSGQLVDEIKFESTFMTKSYCDGEITIPCSANKENRTPVSMLHRGSNPKIFEKTETAKIYKMDRPVMVLVEDTSKNSEYIETYSNQKARIQSSVILPVLSHENVMLGALVVHCDKAGFFKNEMYNFWNELLEMFSVEIGYQKLLLDYYIENAPQAKKPF